MFACQSGHLLFLFCFVLPAGHLFPLSWVRWPISLWEAVGSEPQLGLLAASMWPGVSQRDNCIPLATVIDSEWTHDLLRARATMWVFSSPSWRLREWKAGAVGALKPAQGRTTKNHRECPSERWERQSPGVINWGPESSHTWGQPYFWTWDFLVTWAI